MAIGYMYLRVAALLCPISWFVFLPLKAALGISGFVVLASWFFSLQDTWGKPEKERAAFMAMFDITSCGLTLLGLLGIVISKFQ